MSVKMDIDVNVDVNGDIKKVNNDSALWTFIATEWWRLITPYTPMDTGTLFESVHIEPKIIEYRVPYAWKMYEGDSFNFRTDKHQLASAHWDITAKPQQYSKLVQSAQDYIDTKFKI